MRARSLALPVLAAGLLALSGCASKSLSASPAEADEPTPTVPIDTIDSTTAEPAPTVIDSATTDAGTITTDSTVPAETVPPETAPPETAPPETEAPPETAPPETTPPETEAPAEVPAPPPVEPTVEAVAALDEPIEAVGSGSGAATERAQWRLLELGFWLQNPNGTFEHTTRQAVMAFQKFHGLSADGVLGSETAAAMSAATERARGRTDAGTLVEVDKSKQLLFIVVDGRTEFVFNTSTGSEIAYEEPNKNDPTKIERGNSITPNGLHKVYREREEGWWEGDLGEIYRPKYFAGGNAVHGSNSIPNYPASHGCVRVSVQAMDWIWDTAIVPMNTPVWVHGAVPA